MPRGIPKDPEARHRRRLSSRRFGSKGLVTAVARATDPKVIQFLNSIREATTPSDITDMLRVLRAARKATTLLFPKGRSGPPSDDDAPIEPVEVPDYKIRLEAIRLHLAYVAGQPPTQADLRRLTSTDEERRASHEEKLAELREMGVTLQELLSAVASEEKPAEKLVEAIEVVDDVIG